MHSAVSRLQVFVPHQVQEALRVYYSLLEGPLSLGTEDQGPNYSSAPFGVKHEVFSISESHFPQQQKWGLNCRLHRAIQRMIKGDVKDL